MSISPLSQFDGELIDGLQFCAMTYALFEQIRSTESGPSRLRMRATKVEKKLIEELLPICKYVQAKYEQVGSSPFAVSMGANSLMPKSFRLVPMSKKATSPHLRIWKLRA